MQAALRTILRRFIRVGRLVVTWPDGSIDSFGVDATPSAAIAITSRSAVRHIVWDPTLAFGEAYMDGTLVPIDCSIFDVLDIVMTNIMRQGLANPLLNLRLRVERALRRLRQFNPAPRSRRNVAHHYDLNGRLYQLFLDRDRQYSCAYFRTGDETLDEAQHDKKRHIAAKLNIDRPDLHVLDIGCGWGGLALTLARDHGARVTGITLSTEQLAEAQARARAEGLEDRVRFELLDYRRIVERFGEAAFDRIVSVGMFEHVGVGHYQAFFTTVRRALARDGVALLHTIGRNDTPGATNKWIARYIFPGGYTPALSEIVAPVERAGLLTSDVEVLRLHYAETLRHWRRRFAAKRDAIAALYDERFCRMFEFYMAGAELGFRRQSLVVFQVQMVLDHGALPLTRDYITQSETAAAPRARAETMA